MATAVWKGSIGFGLVNIPVVLYSAEGGDDLEFHMLDKRDQSRIQYRRVSAKSGKEVSWDDIVKGYEYEKGKYIVLTDEDFEQAQMEKSDAAEIVGFVERGAIGPHFFERPYYVAPMKNGVKGYALIREVLQRTDRVAIARIILRVREYIAALFATEEGLMLSTLRYAHEFRSADTLGMETKSLSALGIKPKEVALAEKLVEEMSDEWRPEDFQNAYHKTMRQVIDLKLKHRGKKTAPAPKVKKEPGKVLDLMSLLQKSVEGKSSSGSERALRKSAPRKKSTTTAKKRRA